MAKKPKSDAEVGVMILAAGMGKRMRSPLPKVLHEIGGQSMLFHILDRLAEVLPSASIALVVGHGRELVEKAVRSAQAIRPHYKDLKISFIHQAEQKGTGHAARCAMDAPWGAEQVKAKSLVLVLPGDLPLISTDAIAQMVAPMGRFEVLRLLSCELPDPTGYGRIVRRGKEGAVQRITEEKDATAREKEIKEVGTSIYMFESAFLRAGLHRLSNRNAQGEYYLTDLIAQAARVKKRIGVLKWSRLEDVRGVNDPWELAQAARMLNDRCVRKWALAGVRFLDPSSVSLDCSVQLEEQAVVHPGAILRGATRVARGAVIGPHCVLTDMRIGEGAQIKAGTVGDSSAVGAGAQVGPYAHLRPESVVGNDAKIGNFVELKKSVIGDKTSVAHLSYLGDATVGKNVNIGCGFVTCNFDGRVINGERKHRTVIEDDVFLGSDCQAVAPVRIGKGAFIASGSTITEDVEAEALAIARARQVNKPGYARKLKQNKEG